MFVLEWVYQVFLVYIHKFSLLVCELLTVTVIFSKKKNSVLFLVENFVEIPFKSVLHFILQTTSVVGIFHCGHNLADRMQLN